MCMKMANHFDNLPILVVNKRVFVMPYLNTAYEKQIYYLTIFRLK